MEFKYEDFFELINKGQIKEAFSYRASFTPEYLYKFISLKEDNECKDNKDRFYSLENNLLWLGVPEKQNDPYEFKGLYWDDKSLKEAGVSQEAIDGADILLHKKIALTAFTANMNDNLSMWAYYANNHQGFCVKYKVGNKYSIRNVIYGEQRKTVTKTFLSLLRNPFRDKNFMEEAEKDMAILQDKFFYKHDSWSYEKEYRALYPCDANGIGLNVSISELGLSVAEIYSGINCSEENKRELARIAKKLKVPYKECAISATDFTVFHER